MKNTIFNQMVPSGGISSLSTSRTYIMCSVCIYVTYCLFSYFINCMEWKLQYETETESENLRFEFNML